MKKDLNSYISKSSVKLLDKFKQELEDFRNETGEDVVTLYEDAYISFTLGDIRLEDGSLVYSYEGEEERDNIVRYDEDNNDYFEDTLYGIADTVKFWRSCLRRAKRYWSMDVEKLDKIQNGEIEDNDED